MKETKIKNYMRKCKSPEPLSKDIEEFAESEKAELKDMGIELKGLFSQLEPEALKIAKDYADFYTDRYEAKAKRLMKEDPEKFAYLVRIGQYNPDGTLPERRKQHQFRMGLTQKAFEIFLQQVQVPYIPNDPTIDWRDKFRYDFRIPLFGEIDIKSATFQDLKVNINCGEFEKENPDFVVAYVIFNMNKPKWLKLLGYLTNSEVKEYEPRGSGYRTFWSIPSRDFEKRDGNELYMRLMVVKKILRLTEHGAW